MMEPLDGDASDVIVLPRAVVASREEEEEDSDAPPDMVLGGTLTPPAFCVLDGFREDAGEMTERVTAPILRLPVTVGRAHNAMDPHAEQYFVGLGGNDNVAKAVSRQHIRIDYRVATSTGKCGFLQSKSDKGEGAPDFVYCLDDPVSAADIIHCSPDGDDKRTLPDTGFFTLTVVGRNRVLVQGQRVESGQTALLVSGSPIRMANFCFYFLTPALTTTPRRTMVIPEEGDAVSASPTAPVPASVPSAAVAAPKKRKLSVSTAVPAVAGSGGGPTTATGATSGKPSLISEIEDLSTDELLQQMTAAVEEQVWDRRHQLIGSTISCRAVLVAARDRHLYRVAMEHEGQLSRTEVMDWIAASPVFRTWVEQMLSKMEAKSYQASITKALIKAGFTRTASTGRYIKWHLPESLQPSPPPKRDEDDEDDAPLSTAAHATFDSHESEAPRRDQSSTEGVSQRDATRESEDNDEEDDDEEEEQENNGNSEQPNEQDDDDDEEDDDIDDNDHTMTGNSEIEDTDNARSLLSDEIYF